MTSKTEHEKGPQSFKVFEHEGWQHVANKYHDHFQSLTIQSIDKLLEKAGVSSGKKLLDIASGPGYVAARAMELGADAIGVDFSSVMVAKASKDFPEIQFKEADAEQLPFADKTFDAACMNFGLLHLDRPEQALKEAGRVLKTDCRFAFSVWAEPQEALAFGIVLKAIQDHGDVSITLPAGPPFFRFSAATESQRCLKDAGFKDIEINKVSMMWRLPSAQHFFEAFYLGTPRTGGLLRAQSKTDLEKIRQAVIEDVSRFTVGDHLEVPMASIVASGSKG